MQAQGAGMSLPGYGPKGMCMWGDGRRLGCSMVLQGPWVGINVLGEALMSPCVSLVAFRLSQSLQDHSIVAF